MSSKSGGLDAGIRGRGGQSKAFDASCLNLSSDEIFCQNSMGAAVFSKDGGRSRAEEKVSEVSFKTTSSGGHGGQEAISDASLLRQLLEKQLTHLFLKKQMLQKQI